MSDLPTHIALDGQTDLIFLDRRGASNDVVAAVRYYDTGEVREQMVCDVNFHDRWKLTVTRRASRLERNSWTPHMLLPTGGRRS